MTFTSDEDALNSHLSVKPATMDLATDIPAILAEAVRHENAGANERALSLYDQVLAQDSGNVVAHTSVGALRAARGDLAAAADHYRQALGLRFRRGPSGFSS
jgi:Tfp pilus assembly protein PilF